MKRGYAVDYRNVKNSPSDLDVMVQKTAGKRQVPVIVEGDRVTIGFGGT